MGGGEVWCGRWEEGRMVGEGEVGGGEEERGMVGGGGEGTGIGRGRRE